MPLCPNKRRRLVEAWLSAPCGSLALGAHPAVARLVKSAATALDTRFASAEKATRALAEFTNGTLLSPSHAIHII